MLRFTTFGGVSLADDRGPLTGAPLQRRRLALLAILSVAGERGVSRDKLIGYLWPEREEARGRHALRQWLTLLRRDAPSAAGQLVLGSAELRLNSTLITSDVADFCAVVARGRMASVAELEQAASLYTGNFLDGFFVAGAPEFERWVESQRHILRQQASHVLETLARRAVKADDVRSAAEWWRRLTVIDPLSGQAACGYMRALAASGESAGALEFARAHETTLREEFDVAPSSEVTHLASQLRREPSPGATPSAARVGVPAADALRHRYLEHVSQALAGRYRLRDQLERGRIATALRAIALGDGTEVTVHVIQPSLAAMLDVKRFLSDVRRVMVLAHPNVNRVVDAGDTDGVVFYVTEPVHGVTLRARMEADRQLALAEAVDIATDLAGALAAAHADGVLHLDIKPRNVELRAGRGVLLGVGIALAIAVAAGEAMTRTGITLGTPAYMSPEQVAGEHQPDGLRR